MFKSAALLQATQHTSFGMRVKCQTVGVSNISYSPSFSKHDSSAANVFIIGPMASHLAYLYLIYVIRAKVHLDHVLLSIPRGG